MTSRSSATGTPLMGRFESLTLVAVLGVLALALGVVALVGPAAKASTERTPLRDTGVFSYSATAPARSAYGPDGLRTGQPIITNALGPVTASFAYTLSAGAAATAHGKADFAAIVTLDQGFTKTFPLAATRSFEGDSVTVSGTLPTAAIKAYVDSADAALRDTAGPFGATVALVPHISLTGTVADQSFERNFAPALPFRLNGSTLSLAATPDGAGETTTLLKPTATDYVVQHITEPRNLSLVIAHVSRNAGMAVGFGLTVLLLAVALWLARPLLGGAGSRSNVDRIRALYGSQLTPVRALHLPEGPIVDVASMAALAELAKQYDARIIHLNEDEGDVYVVWDNGMLYRYCSGEFVDGMMFQTLNERLVVWPVVVSGRGDREAAAALVD